MSITAIIISGIVSASIPVVGISSSCLYERKWFKTNIYNITRGEMHLHQYRYQDNTYIIKEKNKGITVEIKDLEKELHCDIKFPNKIESIYSFSYDKTHKQVYAVKEDRWFIPKNKKNEMVELLESFLHFIITEKWKLPFNGEPKLLNKKENIDTKIEEGMNEISLEDRQLEAINKKIEKQMEWLKKTNLLEIEEIHIIETLQRDKERILHSYLTFREETKENYKTKVIEGLEKIEGKVNNLSSKKEKMIGSNIEKLLTLIDER